MADLALLIDLFGSAERQGPGSVAMTRRAIDLAGLAGRRALKIADIGCGTGASTLVLAGDLDAQVTAIDFAAEFLAALDGRAARAGLAGRIHTVQADMARLPLAHDSLDVIWSEGAVYNLGFENGVRQWRRLLKDDGILAVSELSWLTDRRPAGLQACWEAQYAEIGTTSCKLGVLERNGYAPLGCFVLPQDCWLDAFYRPLQQQFVAFLDRQHHSPAAQAVVAAEQAEIELYRRYPGLYGYVFYVARKAAAPWPD